MVKRDDNENTNGFPNNSIFFPATSVGEAMRPNARQLAVKNI